jgi:hypothetical protein
MNLYKLITIDHRLTTIEATSCIHENGFFKFLNDKILLFLIRDSNIDSIALMKADKTTYMQHL